MTQQELAKYIDHTILAPDAPDEKVKTVCDEAKKYGFASVCINPGNVKLAARQLVGSDVKAGAVIGFPLGATTSAAKAFEAQDAIKNGACELDMVINIGAIKSGRWEDAAADVRGVVRVAEGQALVKVILETCLLTDDEKVLVCKLCMDEGADYVKTSTGFASGGATVHDVRLMRRIVGAHMGVKASGGIRDFDTAMAMIEAGASRLGCSASVHIVESII